MFELLQNNNKLLLIIALIFHLVLVIWAFTSIKKGGTAEFQYQLPLVVKFLTGSFVKGDLLVFSSLAVVLSAGLFFVNDIRYTLLALLIYGVVRMAGEVIYWFNYQFSPESTHEFVNNFSFIGNISKYDIFILFQITTQSFLIICLMLLFALIKNWERIGELIAK